VLLVLLKAVSAHAITNNPRREIINLFGAKAFNTQWRVTSGGRGTARVALA